MFKFLRALKDVFSGRTASVQVMEQQKSALKEAIESAIFDSHARANIRAAEKALEKNDVKKAQRYIERAQSSRREASRKYVEAIKKQRMAEKNAKETEKIGLLGQIFR